MLFAKATLAAEVNARAPVPAASSRRPDATDREEVATYGQSTAWALKCAVLWVALETILGCGVPYVGLVASRVRGAAVRALLEERGTGTPAVNYRLRDWLISRQRFWGTPIPILHGENGELINVPKE